MKTGHRGIVRKTPNGFWSWTCRTCDTWSLVSRWETAVICGNSHCRFMAGLRP